MSHKIYISYYGTDGTISTWYTPSISIIELPSTSVATGTMTYNATLGNYKYTFSSYDSTKEYMVNVDFWGSAPTRYVSMLLSEMSLSAVNRNVIKASKIIPANETF